LIHRGLSSGRVSAGLCHCQKNRTQRHGRKRNVSRFSERGPYLSGGAFGIEKRFGEADDRCSRVQLQPVLWRLLGQCGRSVKCQFNFTEAVRQCGEFFGEAELAFFEISDVAGEGFDFREVVRGDLELIRRGRGDRVR